MVYHGVLPYAICRDGPKKEMAATLKVRKWPAQNVDVRLVKSFHEHYQLSSGASMRNGTFKFAGEHRWSIINHRVLHSLPIGLVGDFQSSHVLICLPLYAIFLSKTVTSSSSLLVAWYSNCFSAASSTSGFRNWWLFSSIDPYAVVSNQFRSQLLTVKLLL